MKGESFSPLKCERFHLGKTSNRWWACHGGLQNMHPKPLVFTGSRHSTKAGDTGMHQRVKGVGFVEWLTNGLVDM
jgi:hypothetical protein